jgi:hypothetical protein
MNPRVDARHSPTPCTSSSFARRGRLVTSARRAASRRRSVPVQEVRREGQLTNNPAQESTARRPNTQPFHARRQRAPGGLARRLGVAAARRLPCPPIPPEPASLFARRRRSSEAQPAQEPPSAAARQSCGTKASTQARNSIAMRLHTWIANTGRIQGGEEKRKAAVLTVGRRCSRGRPDEGVSLVFRREGVPAR